MHSRAVLGCEPWWSQATQGCCEAPSPSSSILLSGLSPSSASGGFQLKWSLPDLQPDLHARGDDYFSLIAHMRWLHYVSSTTRAIKAKLCCSWLGALWCSVQFCLSLANEDWMRFVQIGGPVVKKEITLANVLRNVQWMWTDPWALTRTFLTSRSSCLNQRWRDPFNHGKNM